MVSSIQRLGLTPNATIEQRKLAVDVAQVIVKWEFQRVREQQDQEVGREGGRGDGGEGGRHLEVEGTGGREGGTGGRKGWRGGRWRELEGGREGGSWREGGERREVRRMGGERREVRRMGEGEGGRGGGDYTLSSTRLT